MASGSELPEYSSQAERRKIDSEVYGVSVHFNIDLPDLKDIGDNQIIDFEEHLGVDSGFTEMSENGKSLINTPESSHLASTPSRTDSTSDDTGCPLDTADEKDEVSSTVSNLSDLSGLSDVSESSNRQRSTSAWLQKQMQTGTDPRDLLQHLLMDSTQIPDQVDDITLWKLVLNIMSDPPRRQKLNYVNTLSDVVRLIKDSRKIIVLTGAGVSVSCGIPDFRSRDGIYSRLAQDFPNLPDPQAMFDINFFGQDPRPFFKFAREIYPGQFKPSPCHRFIKMLEKQKKLLRNYSQNIDTLEQVAGIENVIECHGSFATASCTKCKFQVTAEDIRQDIFSQRIPLCPRCSTNALPSLATTSSSENYSELVSQGIMKPDIVFFGEGLPDAFHDSIAKDKDECDLLIVIGSSLKVRPVALIPSSIPSHVPQILINRESLPHLKFDVELLGDGDIIINQLCHLMGEEFAEVCWNKVILEETPHLLPPRFTEDSWCRGNSSQEVSQDSTEVTLKPKNEVSNESQDSLSINSTSRLGNSEICISPFHAGHIENENSFLAFSNSPKRPLEESSVESSPKRFRRSDDDRFSRFNRVESTSETSGQVFNLEECHVIPRMIEATDRLESSDTTGLRRINSEFRRSELREESAENSGRSDEKFAGKTRHASIDSAIDSGIGDSCNSVDSAEVRETEEEKREEMERRWQAEMKESLASRLPENCYYQVSSGKYIFSGAEIYCEPDEFDEDEDSPGSRSPTESRLIYPESDREAP